MKKKEIEIGENLGCVLIVLFVCMTIVLFFLVTT